jgi:hypothetical protein
MNDIPLDVCRPSGGWPTVFATQWKIRLFGPTGEVHLGILVDDAAGRRNHMGEVQKPVRRFADRAHDGPEARVRRGPTTLVQRLPHLGR